jgi:hypothetical protein
VLVVITITVVAIITTVVVIITAAITATIVVVVARLVVLPVLLVVQLVVQLANNAVLPVLLVSALEPPLVVSSWEPVLELKPDLKALAPLLLLLALSEATSVLKPKTLCATLPRTWPANSVVFKKTNTTKKQQVFFSGEVGALFGQKKEI